MSQRLLPEYLDSAVMSQPSPEDKISALEDSVRRMEREIDALKLQMKALGKEHMRVIGRLLSPLYSALQPVFGEMEAADDAPATASGQQAKWDVVKQRLAPRLREAIDILQMQGTMKRTQLASALKMDYSNCTKNVVGILLRQGWIVDNGGNLALKNL